MSRRARLRILAATFVFVVAALTYTVVGVVTSWIAAIIYEGGF